VRAPEAVGSPVDDLRAAVDLVVRAAHAYGRPDLADRVSAAARPLDHAEARVAVLGGFKHGKSSLVNVLLQEAACGVDPVVGTGVATLIRHAPERAAAAVRHAEDGTGHVAEPLGWPDRLAATAEPAAGVALVELAVPARLLEAGVVLVDVPGVGGPDAAEQRAALHLDVDAALVVHDAARVLTATELARVVDLHRAGVAVAVVPSRTDLHVHWRAVAEATAAALRAAGVDAPVLPASARLADVAVAEGDRALLDASGVLDVGRWVVAQAAEVHRRRAQCVRAVAADAVAVLRAAFEQQLVALDGDPADAVPAAERALAERRTATARGQQVLVDQLGAAAADVDHDLRGRLRDLQREADEAVDAGDPATGWPDLERWVTTATAAALDAHLVQAVERLDAVVDAALAAAGLPPDPPVDLDLDLGDETGWAGGSAVDGLAAPEMREDARGRPGLGAQGLSLVRSSYGGVAMFGALAGLAGLPVVAPVVAAAGLALGARGLSEERKRLLAQRRAAAKAALRRYVDDAGFLAGKASRDLVRVRQGAIRTAVQQRLEEAMTSARADLDAAVAAGRADAATRAARRADAEAELRRLAALDARLAAA
jgi:hypothetical protein